MASRCPKANRASQRGHRISVANNLEQTISALVNHLGGGHKQGLARRTDALHVLENHRQRACDGLLVDAESREQFRQLFDGMRTSANERIQIVGRDTELVRDAREFASVELAHLANLLSMLEPVVEHIDQLADDRVWLNLSHWALRCWFNFDKYDRRQKTVRHCGRSKMEKSK